MADTGAWVYTISSPCEPEGSGELIKGDMVKKPTAVAFIYRYFFSKQCNLVLNGRYSFEQIELTIFIFLQ